jgi:hypothetical protein
VAAGLTRLLLAVALAAPATGCRASRGPSTPPAPTPRSAPATPVARADVSRLDVAIHRYAADRAGRLPHRLTALAEERSPEGGAYVPKVPETDPWGAPYAYAVLDARLGTYDLRSYGPDRLPGTEDDVVARADPVPID